MKTALTEGSLRPQTRVTVLLAAVIALVLGAAGGLGSFTFVYAKGAPISGTILMPAPTATSCTDHLDALV